jgi:hypothetical protein
MTTLCVLQHPVKKLGVVIKDAELLDLCKGLLAIDPALRLEGVQPQHKDTRSMHAYATHTIQCM